MARWGSTNAFAAGGVGAAISAWSAEECSRVSGQELPGEGEKLHGDLESTAREREVGDWKRVDVFQPVEASALSRSFGDTRLVLIWEMVDGKKNVKARLISKGYQDPDLRGSFVDASGCVSL